jgi:hypothetical protein
MHTNITQGFSRSACFSRSHAAAILFILALGSGACFAESQFSGFVLVNATGSNEPIMASFAGKPVLKEPGLDDAARTSGLGVEVGKNRLEVTNPTLGTAHVELDIAPGSTPVVVAYSQKDSPTTGAQGTVAKPKKKIALKLLSARPESAKGDFQVIFVGDENNESISPVINGGKVSLRPWRLQTIKGPRITIKNGDKPIKESYQNEPTTWFVFLLVDEGGEMKAVSFPQTIYKW